MDFITVTGIKERYKVSNSGKREVILPMLMEGWGNARDSNYYSRNAIMEATSELAKRKKMYINHPKNPSDDRDIRDWGASIIEAFIDEVGGKLISMGRAKVYDDWLWERFQVAPNEIATSMLGSGKSRKTTIEDRSANLIESIAVIKSVDFVDYGGNTKSEMNRIVERERRIRDGEISEAQMAVNIGIFGLNGDE